MEALLTVQDLTMAYGERVILEGQQDGLFRTDVDARLASWVVYGGLEEILSPSSALLRHDSFGLGHFRRSLTMTTRLSTAAICCSRLKVSSRLPSSTKITSHVLPIGFNAS